MTHLNFIFAAYATCFGVILSLFVKEMLRARHLKAALKVNGEKDA